MISNFMWSY